MSDTTNPTSQERKKLTPQELDAMMPAGEYVHTFMQGGNNLLIGCDMKRSEILSQAIEGVELSGETATAMKHGTVLFRKGKVPIFVETV